MKKEPDKHISDDILEILRKHLVDHEYYINPHFLLEISKLLYDYYEKENDEVDKEIQDMFGW